MFVVLGGGIGGLSAAHYLQKFTAKPIILIEASSRLGGWIKTTSIPGGFIFEQGPRTVRPKGVAGENTLALIEDLRLVDKVVPIPYDHPVARNRFIYVNKTLHALPNNVLSLLVTRPPFSKPLINALFQDLKAPKKSVKDESIYEFVERRLGKEIAEYAVSPLISGICAGDAKEISVKFIMKSLFDAEQAHGSIMKGMLLNMLKRKHGDVAHKNCALYERAQKEKWSVWSLDGGLEMLPEMLRTSIKSYGSEILLNSPCGEITFKSDKAILKTKDRSIACDHIVSSLPARHLAPLLVKQHPELSNELASIPSVTVAVVHLQFQGRVLKKEAFGFLVPACEKLPILGVVFDTCCFPKGDNTVLTVMIGGRWFEELFGKDPSPERLLSTAVHHVRQILNIPGAPETHQVSILRDCIPQYVIGHHERVERIRNYVSRHDLPLSLIGASYDGIGINDVILSARTAASCLESVVG